jgi:hypothetical protein
MLSEENMTNRTEASRQFLRKFSQRFFTTSEVLKDGLPSRLSSIKLPLPSENLLCHLNTNERLTLECVTDRLMNLCVSVGYILFENVVFSDEEGFIFKV